MSDSDIPATPSLHATADLPRVAGYRADIDGLRAVAVLGVVAFHAFPLRARGGFVGVDIFFVISGFLISSIIVGALVRGDFSFATFYGRRIRRIFPALLLVLTACLVGGWFLLLADEYRSLGKHIAAGAGFVSNFVLMRESGYFDNDAAHKPLLHLWSLGIEEQFYLAWPLLLWMAWKARAAFPALVMLLVLASFTYNILTITVNPVGAFYLPHARIWELLVGAALAIHVANRPQSAPAAGPRATMLSVAGAALLAASFAVITPDDVFPGWWALLPTAGAACLLAAGPAGWVNRVVLSNRVLVWFGLISFPLYLWHWPLLSFATIVEGDLPSRPVRIAAVCAAILLAWLTYRLIERPVRFGAARGRTEVVLAGLIAATGVAGYVCFSQGGFSGWGIRHEGTQAFADYFENSPPEWRYYHRIGAFEKSRIECNFYDVERFRQGRATPVPRAAIADSCHLRDPRLPRAVFLWGDSHAQQLHHGLRTYLPADWQMLQVASSDCVPDPSVAEDSSVDACRRSNWFAMRAIGLARPDVVVVAQNKGHSADAMARIAARLKAAGVGRVVFTGPTPHWTTNLPSLVLRKLWLDTPERTLIGIDQQIMEANAALKRRFRASADVVLVDVIGLFCNPQGCLTRIGADKKTGITSWDYGHLTPIASEFLAGKLLANVVVGAQPAQAAAQADPAN